MQTFGAGKWPSRSVGDLVGEYDGLGRREYLRENSASGE